MVLDICKLSFPCTKHGRKFARRAIYFVLRSPDRKVLSSLFSGAALVGEIATYRMQQGREQAMRVISSEQQNRFLFLLFSLGPQSLANISGESGEERRGWRSPVPLPANVEFSNVNFSFINE